MARQATPNLLAEAVDATPRDDVRLIMGEPGQGGAPVDVDLDLIDDNPYQPRLTYDEAALQELADSIAANGLVQPVSGRRKSDGRYELEQGHRRLRAFRLLRAKHEGEHQRIPMFVRTVADFDLAMRAWAENHDREGITAIEEAQWIQRMMTDFDLSQAVMAKRLGKSAATVANKLRLLRAPEEVRDAVAAGEISERQAASLMPIFDLPPEALQRAQSDGGGYGYRIGDLLKQAKDGHSSDSLRERADIVIRNATLLLKGEPWTTTDFGIGDVRSRLCTSCTERVMHRNEERCSVQTCFQIKKQAWNDYQLAALVEAAGVPAMPVSASYNEYHSFWGEDRRIAEEHGLNKPPLCDRLRVARGNDGLLVPGVEGGKFICYHRGDKCRCLTNIKRELSKDAKGRWKRIREQTKDALAAALSAPTPDTIRLLAGFYASYDKRDEVASWRMEDVVAIIVKALMEQAQPHEPEKRIDEAQTAMANLLARAYITPPWSMYAAMAPAPDPLQQMRDRVELIRTWIGSQTVKHGAPSQEELQRIADSSRECQQELAGIPASAERDELALQLDAANQSAEEMISLVSDGYDGSKEIAWIVNTPISDLNAKGAVDRATREDLCWALAVCRVLDQKKTTIEAIQVQLRKLDKTIVKMEGQRNAFPTSGGKRIVVHGWPTTTEEKLTNGYIEPTVDREAPDYIDAKLRRVAGWIDEFQDLGDGLPTPESVAGNFVNLEKLLETIITQPSEEDQLKLKQLYDHVYASLAALSDRVNQSYALEQEN